MSADEKSSVASGQIVGGAYRIEETLGGGGIGLVWSATRIADGARVAIKVLQVESLADDVARARLFREAWATTAISHAHIVRVLDVGALAGGAPYLVMERLDGEDLATRLRRRGPLDLGGAIAITRQLCSGIAAAHARGIIHRDIK